MVLMADEEMNNGWKIAPAWAVLMAAQAMSTEKKTVLADMVLMAGGEVTNAG